MWFYRAFGLILESDIELPELLEAQPPAAITLRTCPVPETLENVIGRGITFQASADQVLFIYPNGMRFLVIQGREIWVEPGPEATPEMVRTYLLGPVIGVLLIQRNHLVLHGSAIDTSWGACLFCGDPGAGKSTLAGGFQKRGYDFLSDDHCVISQESKPPCILPGFPQLRLLESSFDYLDLEKTVLIDPTGSGDKYHLKMSDQFTQEIRPLNAVYILEESADTEIHLNSLQGWAKISALLSHTYGLKVVQASGLAGRHFQQVANLSNSVAVRRVSFPKDLHRLEALLDRLERDFRNISEKNGKS